jgi:hypothetical protein
MSDASEGAGLEGGGPDWLEVPSHPVKRLANKADRKNNPGSFVLERFILGLDPQHHPIHKDYNFNRLPIKTPQSLPPRTISGNQ